MAGGIVDRWTRPDPATGERVRTERWGKGRRWRLEWVDDGGKRRSRSYVSKDAAKDDQAAIRADLLRGRYLDPNNGNITFREFAKVWMSMQSQSMLTAEGTGYRLERYVYPVFGDLPLRSITSSMVTTWLRGLERDGLAVSTRHLILGHVKAILGAAVNDDLVAKSAARRGAIPALPARSPAVTSVWPLQWVHAMRAELPERFQLAVLIAAGAGLRASEVFGLAAEDVNLFTRTIHVRRQVLRRKDGAALWSLPKFDKTREVPIPDSLCAAIRAHMAKFPPIVVELPYVAKDDPRPVGSVVERRSLLLYSREKGPINKNYWSRHIWGPARGRADIPAARANGMHALRHFYASTLLEGGESIVTVAARLGHADPGFTLRVYTHPIDDGGKGTRSVMDAVLTAPTPAQPANVYSLADRRRQAR